MLEICNLCEAFAENSDDTTTDPESNITKKEIATNKIILENFGNLLLVCAVLLYNKFVISFGIIVRYLLSYNAGVTDTMSIHKATNFEILIHGLHVVLYTFYEIRNGKGKVFLCI